MLPSLFTCVVCGMLQPLESVTDSVCMCYSFSLLLWAFLSSQQFPVWESHTHLLSQHVGPRGKKDSGWRKHGLQREILSWLFSKVIPKVFSWVDEHSKVYLSNLVASAGLQVVKSWPSWKWFQSSSLSRHMIRLPVVTGYLMNQPGFLSGI